MACDATARLYDVDENSVVFKKLEQSQKYDHGTVTFSARRGKLIDLDKLHESIWATRLSGGTRSGLISLEVTAIGQLVQTDNETILRVADSDAEFILKKNPDDEQAAAFGRLKDSVGTSGQVRVTGRIDDYAGRWPDLLKNRPSKPRRILVTGFESAE